jgi:hypothetical protein
MWPYLISRLLAITIIIVPLCAGFFIALVIELCTPQVVNSFGDYFYLAWGFSLFGYAWTYLLWVLLPYSIIYIKTRLRFFPVVFKYILFYLLMVIMGIIAPEVSFIDLFEESLYPGVLMSPHPRALFLYFLMSITLGPLMNFLLNKIVKPKENSLFIQDE